MSDALRRSLLESCLAMHRSGLSPGRSGNQSLRGPDGVWITPSGLAYEALEPEDLVLLDLAGRVREGTRAPSSEWRMHCEVYAARPEVGAIVHSHSRFATVLACTGRAIPAYHYMVAVAGGRDIRCAPYATFGSPELAAHAVRALEGRRACLLAQHGQLALGPEPAAALELAHEVEELAAGYVRGLQLGGLRILDAAEMDRVLERFAHYGAGTGAAAADDSARTTLDDSAGSESEDPG